MFSYYVTFSNHYFLRSVTVFSFTVFLQMSGFRCFLLFSEAISLHSLLGCNWTSGRHQQPLSVDWSWFNSQHRLTTLVASLLRRWCLSMVLRRLPTSMVSVEQANPFETCDSNHQAEKTSLLLNLPFFSSFKSSGRK